MIEMANFAGRIRRFVTLQLLLLAVTSVLFFMIYGAFQAGSVWGGGAIATSSALWLEWRRWQAEHGRVQSAGEGLRLLYRTALERFVWVTVLFAFALGVLHLDPLALISGFIVGQLALLLTGIVGTD